ncbi:PREDICTED: MAP7 domain-containing protein 1-like isoform X2 [Ipomoea nil]|uniref:MAP7 domain-containing protein 1-like isoform X1 n=1 Tax=Ipomoea nil TaxID=35883 RepID=UPI000900DBD8|nr:PREDICTED: MAP7 domain-containing protein 1-like isoform X1 [Ipomoea nil]XP_019191001.1 PREDICTED: MAP7 domain-containing protein 1-like isoform X2 [Ipomoea nil]
MADSEPQLNHATHNPSKYYYNHFLFKALIVTLFLVLLPLFPSQPPPDSINQSLHTRSWEILQLIFVGIAVSYGLFSRKSDEIDKENNGFATTKFDNAQSYVSRLLQVSSVFDDESEDGSVFDDHDSSSDNKVMQTWNNQYRRGEAVVVVAKDGVEEQTVKSSKVGEKPLLLPVRSLKSRVAEADDDLKEEAKMKSGSKRFWSKSMEDNNNKGEENLVLPSPIPWRSRSGRMEMKEESKLFSSSSSSMAEDPEFNKLEPRSFRSQSFTRPNSTSPSPSPSPESSQQLRILEEMARKTKTTPAPPPPPPHYFLGKSSSMKSSALAAKKKEDYGSSSEKELRRSVRSVPAEIPIPDEVKGEEAAGKSARTLSFTPFNGRGRSYAIAKAKENFVKKEGEGEGEESEMEDEDDFFDENMVAENGSEYNSSGDGGPPDVDKKADEFIAKFREQIRLQRIESIRRSAGQTAAARNQLVR